MLADFFMQIRLNIGSYDSVIVSLCIYRPS